MKVLEAAAPESRGRVADMPRRSGKGVVTLGDLGHLDEHYGQLWREKYVQQLGLGCPEGGARYAADEHLAETSGDGCWSPATGLL